MNKVVDENNKEKGAHNGSLGNTTPDRHGRTGDARDNHTHSAATQKIVNSPQEWVTEPKRNQFVHQNIVRYQVKSFSKIKQYQLHYVT